MSSTLLKCCLYLAVTLVLSGGVSRAATVYWSGATSNNWGAANWQDALTGGAPASFATGDDVIFTVDGGGANLSTTLGANRTINSLTVNGSLGGPLTIANNTLTINASGGTGMDLSAAANTVSFTSLITLGSSQTWLLSPTHDLSLTQNIGGAAHTLTIDGSGGGTINIGDTTNNSYDVDHLVLTNGATLRTTQDNSSATTTPPCTWTQARLMTATDLPMHLPA